MQFYRTCVRKLAQIFWLVQAIGRSYKIYSINRCRSRLHSFIVACGWKSEQSFSSFTRACCRRTRPRTSKMSQENCSGIRELLEEFIQFYKNEVCLWNKKSKDYHDRNKKNAAYDRLIDKYRHIDPNANREYDFLLRSQSLHQTLRDFLLFLHKISKATASASSSSITDDMFFSSEFLRRTDDRRRYCRRVDTLWTFDKLHKRTAQSNRYDKSLSCVPAI